MKYGMEVITQGLNQALTVQKGLWAQSFGLYEQSLKLREQELSAVAKPLAAVATAGR
tara:strand:- start:314 stop:484 length:171 start_codon:yes stop_codon:yes gene_type:complete